MYTNIRVKFIYQFTYFLNNRYEECHCVDRYQWTARSTVIPGTHQIIDAPLCNITDPCYTNARIRITNTDSIWDAGAYRPGRGGGV